MDSIKSSHGIQKYVFTIATVILGIPPDKIPESGVAWVYQLKAN